MKKSTLENVEEHLVKGLRNTSQALSPIYDYHNTTGHSTTVENFSIVEIEEQNLVRLIKEVTFRWVNDPIPNRNISKYHLLHIWDEVLVNRPDLKPK